MMSLPLPSAHTITASAPAHNSPLALSRARCIMGVKSPIRVLPVAKPVIYAHKLVKETAVSMAHELYDAMMMQDAWWKEWQRLNPGVSRHTLEQRFVNKNLPLLVPQARATMAKCLQPGQCPGLDERQREEILQALLLDNQLVASRAAASANSRDRIRIN